MSLDILEFPRAAQQNSSVVPIAYGAPIKRGSLTAAQTFIPAGDGSTICEFYANGANHTFHWGNAAIFQTLKSGDRISYQLPVGTVITALT
jgi:hypothetical protein